MISPRLLRRRIRSVQSTAKITRAMEMIATAKMKRSQDQALAGRPYSDKITRVIADIAVQAEGYGTLHPLLAKREAKRIAVVGYYTGWRISELLSMKWAQVDFEHGIMRLEPGTTKNEDGRTFPFSELPELLEALKTQREFTKAYEKKRKIIVPYVFHRAGKQMRSIRKGWIDARNKAGLPEKKFHDFRRTAARNLERANVPRTVAKQLMGHRTDQMYERYAITTERDQKEGVKKVAALLSAV